MQTIIVAAKVRGTSLDSAMVTLLITEDPRHGAWNTVHAVRTLPSEQVFKPCRQAGLPSVDAVLS